MNDRILKDFLKHNHATGMALAASSDRLELHPEPGDLPQRYVAEFRCRGLVREPSGKIVEADRFLVGILFPDNFLKTKPNAFRVLTWLEPKTIWHPNIAFPHLCAGNLRMGTDLVSILFQLYEMIVYQKFATADPLNPAAAEFARANMSQFPLDTRPLRRRAIAIEEIAGGKR
jgi:hypothetical protein